MRPLIPVPVRPTLIQSLCSKTTLLQEFAIVLMMLQCSLSLMHTSWPRVLIIYAPTNTTQDDAVKQLGRQLQDSIQQGTGSSGLHTFVNYGKSIDSHVVIYFN